MDTRAFEIVRLSGDGNRDNGLHIQSIGVWGSAYAPAMYA